MDPDWVHNWVHGEHTDGMRLQLNPQNTRLPVSSGQPASSVNSFTDRFLNTNSLIASPPHLPVWVKPQRIGTYSPQASRSRALGTMCLCWTRCPERPVYAAELQVILWSPRVRQGDSYRVSRFRV